MKPKLESKNFLIQMIFAVVLAGFVMPVAFADVYINVLAVNGAPMRKETPVTYNLPGDLHAEDIIDTNGLQLEYNVNDANYVVSGMVTLEPKESKTFRLHVRDIWQVSPQQIDDIKKQIGNGFEQIGKLHDAGKAEVLRDNLIKKLDYIAEQQGSKAETIEKRIDAFRAYRSEMLRIRNQSLAVDYWRSQPGEDKDKIIRMKVEVQSPPDSKAKMVKQKHYLPSEVKPEDVLETEGFEVRFDQAKQQAFLFKEEDIAPGDKRAYSIGIRDIWFIAKRDIDYLRSRAANAFEYLENSKYDQSAKYLFEHANTLLKSIEDLQSQQLEIREHIGAFRVNRKLLEDARVDVENLEKLLSILREDLEKSKVKNVLQKVKSLNGVAGVAKQMFDKKPTASTTWQFIGWTLIFVLSLTLINFIIWLIRSGNKKKNAEYLAPPDPASKK